jgi:hypothetical protein
MVPRGKSNAALSLGSAISKCREATEERTLPPLRPTQSHISAYAISLWATCYGAGTNCLLAKLVTAKLSGYPLFPHHEDSIAHTDDLR